MNLIILLNLKLHSCLCQLYITAIILTNKFKPFNIVLNSILCKLVPTINLLNFYIYAISFQIIILVSEIPSYFIWICFQTCYCEDHVKRKGFKYERNQPIPCPKCNYDTSITKELSMSSKYQSKIIALILTQLKVIEKNPVKNSKPLQLKRQF